MGRFRAILFSRCAVTSTQAAFSQHRVSRRSRAAISRINTAMQCRRDGRKSSEVIDCSSALNAAASREMELYDSLHRRSKEALDNMPVGIALGSLPATVMFWGRKAPKRFVGWIEKKLQDRDDARTLYGRAGLDPHRCAGLMRSRVDYAAIVPRRQIPISLKKERLS